MATCPDCLAGAARARLAAPVLAVPRPATDEIALFVPGPGGTACCVVSVAEARALRGALDGALALIDRPGELPEARHG